VLFNKICVAIKMEVLYNWLFLQVTGEGEECTLQLAKSKLTFALLKEFYSSWETGG